MELFAEICDVFLGKRQQARGIELELTPAQKIRVLRVLAYHMMCAQKREIPEAEAAKVIEDTLLQVMPTSGPSDFLRMVEDSSGLLAQKESGVYGFAHLTFQEYLASLHVKEDKLVAELAGRVNQPWWHETARLYSAQADASPIVQSCLAPARPSVEALLLATDCETEALELRRDLRERLRRVTEEAVEDPEAERRRLAAEHMLSRRIRDMRRIDDEHYIDSSPVNHAEYQLFIEERRNQSEFVQPEHWNSYEFPIGAGCMPVVGISRNDAEEFCRWLTDRTTGEWTYTLPEAAPSVDHAEWKDLRFFSERDSLVEPSLSGAEILARIQQDNDELSKALDLGRRQWWCLIIFTNWFFVRIEERYRPVNLKLGRRRYNDLVLAKGLKDNLSRVLSCSIGDKPAASRALNRSLEKALACARGIDVAEEFENDLKSHYRSEIQVDAEISLGESHEVYRIHLKELTNILSLISRLQRVLDPDPGRDFNLARDLVSHVSMHTANLAAGFFATMLNRLCVAEGRANGTLPPPVTSLWLAKVSRRSSQQEAVAAAGQGS